MKVVFFIAEKNYGLTSLLVGQAIAFNQIKSVEFIFISGTIEKEPGLIEKLNNNNVNLVQIKGLEFHSKFKRIVKEIELVIDKEKPDFIHVQTNWQLALVGYIKTFTKNKFKIIYTIHSFRHNNKLKSIFARIGIGFFLFLFASKVIACSTYTKNKFKLLSYKTEILFLGVDDDFFEKMDNKDLKINGKINIIFPAEFRKGKNQELLIKCLAKYLKTNSDQNIHLILPGDGVNKLSCVRLGSELGIEENLSFPGFLNKKQVIEHIKKSSIAIIPTNSETFGLCIAEPFSYGRCVISRKVGIANDIIRDGENGFIFDKDKELYPLLCKVLLNRDLISRTGNNAFLERNRFFWSVISEKYFDILKAMYD